METLYEFTWKGFSNEHRVLKSVLIRFSLQFIHEIREYLVPFNILTGKKYSKVIVATVLRVRVSGNLGRK